MDKLEISSLNIPYSRRSIASANYTLSTIPYLPPVQLFYHPNAQHDTFSFDKEESKHIVRVLRKQEGESLFVTDGLGSLFICAIVVANPKAVQVRVQKVEKQAPATYNLTLAIAPTKNRDRLEWLVEKATEIGISTIVPLICEHAERQIQKTDRLKKIAIGAMKQSQRFQMPVIQEAVSFKAFVKASEYDQKFIAHLSEPKRFLSAEIEGSGSIVVLVGPEGDFSPKELSSAEESGFVNVALGNYRLRTETAGLVAIQTVAQYFEER
jgi:16S rRNA (uracil1498-N3)-methyltransferase